MAHRVSSCLLAFAPPRSAVVFLSGRGPASYSQSVAYRLQPKYSADTEVDQEGHVAKEDRGFASMDRSKQREIASKGGKAAHQKGTAHEWTSEEAREAGRKGGMASHRRKQGEPDPGGADSDSGNQNQ